MTDVRVGICSWTDRTLLKSGFYPPSASNPASRLAYYASCFDVVEIDSTYYSLADIQSAFRWIAGTPSGFMFGVKSFAIFTFHRARYSSLPAWLKAELGAKRPDDAVRREELSHEQRVRLFNEFMEPVGILRSAERLAYLLFQFPPGWVFSAQGLSYIKRLREMSGPLPLAVEVRNRSWLQEGNREKFLSVLSDQNIAYVAADEPETGWSVPRDCYVTAQWGSVARFHGRNRAGWKKPGASVRERFDYEYARGELNEWAERVKEMTGNLRASGNIFLMFNNCVSDKAVKGALMMSDILGLVPKKTPNLQKTFDFE
jgi:uncharacterized protein YecE (DUF72 family)